jgi:hypothetical protein
MRLRLTIFALLLAACASNKPKPEESSYCAESRGLYCLTQKVCSFDKGRDCFVCQCSSGQSPPMRPVDSPVPTSNGTIRDR